jgi:hypothetical protein
VIYFFANMSVAEVSALAEASNDAALGAALTKVKYTSPADRAGRAGVVSVSHFHGIRLCTEIGTLMDALRRNGIDVYVCTASLEDVVAVFATHPKYGYGVAREQVIGLRLERNGQVFRNAYLKEWPLTWGPGKTVAIKQVLVAQKGYGPCSWQATAMAITICCVTSRHPLWPHRQSHEERQDRRVVQTGCRADQCSQAPLPAAGPPGVDRQLAAGGNQHQIRQDRTATADHLIGGLCA